MDLEYMKQLRNMYAEQHMVSNEFLDELKKALFKSITNNNV